MTRRSLLLTLLSAAPLAASAAAPGHEPGTWWEQTVQMEMPGFAMPAQTFRACMPNRAWTEPPRGRDDQCQMTDVKRTGSRMSWKMTCKDGSTGSGDMTYGPERYEGTMTMRSGGREMHMAMKGHKVGGACDANENQRRAEETRKEIEVQQARIEDAKAQGCARALDDMQLASFLPYAPGAPTQCGDQVADFCRRLGTRPGLVAFRRSSTQPDARKQAERLCRLKLADVEKRVCAEAGAEVSRGRRLDGDTADFVFASCPEEAKAIAKTECAGRSYTGMSEAQREICTKYARESLDRGSPSEPAPSPGVQVPDVKREIFRGIFGR